MTQTTDTPQQTGLTIQDLTLALQVIQVASSRGAFKADELTAVGGLYDRVFKFLEASGAINAQQPATQDQPTEPEVTETVTKKSKKPKEI